MAEDFKGIYYILLTISRYNHSVPIISISLFYFRRIRMSFTDVISVLAGFSWLAVIGVIGFSVMRAARGEARGNTSMVAVVVIIALVLNLASAGLVFIEPTERGVVISALQDGGLRPDVLQPGLNWVVPYLDRVVTYPIFRQTYTMSIAHTEGQLQGDDSVEARTSDGQIVLVDASIIFTLNPVDVIQTHVRWQGNYIDGLVRPFARGVIRDAVSVFGIEEVYGSRRADLTASIRERLEIEFEKEGLTLVEFVLRNIAFTTEYSASVEQKQIAEQLAQQAEFVVQQRVQEAEQARQQAQGVADAAVISAEGSAKSLLINAEASAAARLVEADAEAQALRLLGQALAENPEVLSLQYIEKLAPNIRAMLIPSNGEQFILPLPDLNAIP
jgi:regulator of protease activity HflC (stomatin/prohibitin superfamily)